MSLEDRRALSDFVDELHDVLAHEVRGNPDEFGEAGNDLMEALEELEESGGPFDLVAGQLIAADFADEPDEDGRSLLDRLGLSGANLRLKLGGWARAYDQWRADPGTALRRVFRWSNTLLGSMAGVVGAAEPLKEFKESVENAYEDAQG